MDSCCVDARQSNRSFFRSKWLKDKELGINVLARSQKSDGTVKSSRCKARESLGMRRTYQYVAMTKDEAQRRRWPFYEAVKN
jgi:hypothetical protein